MTKPIFRGIELEAIKEAMRQAEAGGPFDFTGYDDEKSRRLHDAASDVAACLRRNVPRGSALVAMTPFEARSVSYVMGNSINNPDFCKDFLTRAQHDAAYRARLLFDELGHRKGRR